MKLLFVGTDDVLDWTRRKILICAGYELALAHDSKTLLYLEVSDTKLALLSNLLSQAERESIESLIRHRWPDMLLLPFSTDRVGRGPVLPPFADPSEILKIVGSTLMMQHHHAEVDSPFFMYVDRQRRYIHVSHGICELLGMRREQIIGATIDALTYPETADAPALFKEYLSSKGMQGSYILQHADGHPVPVAYDAHIFDDGCMCSCLTPL